MKTKHSLIIAVVCMVSAAGAQRAENPNLARVQSSEQAAMAYLTYVVDPQYPADVRISSKVVLRIVIDREGHVSEANLVSGHPVLVAVTIDAVKQWKFRPYIFDNTP